jgi:inorganic pyrophosphatase
VSDQFQASRPHPWHGLPVGPSPPELIYAYIEITPFDLVKYEVDKSTGYLRVDRPQRTSSQPPALYGFIPRTLCGERLRQLSPTSLRGDGDPLDVCVISERPIAKSEIIVTVRPIGGLQMIDGEDADDKIVAVLDGDFVWGGVTDVSELPTVMMERLHDYFTTYKLVPGVDPRVSIRRVYGRELAHQVIRAALADYDDAFGRYSADGRATDLQ